MIGWKYRRQFVAWVTALLLALTPTCVFADEIDVNLELDKDIEATPVIAAVADSLPAKSAILMDQQTGKVLFEQNADEQLPPASITKVMTLLLVMEAIDSGKITLEDQVTATEYPCSMGGSQIWLEPGEVMTVHELLKAAAIASANDASAQLGEYIAGSVDAFVSMMNTRAAELGMVNTHFVNPTGLDDEGHLTTARDIAIMSRELMSHPLITEYSTIWMDSLRDGQTELVNTNKLVRFYNGATGLKTGTTNGAGSCLSATATRDDLGLISVVMGSPTSNDRFSAARGLLDWGFANYQSAAPPSIQSQLVPVEVIRGTEGEVNVTYDDPGRFVVEKGTQDSITQEVTMVENVQAPVEKGQTLGRVDVVINGEIVGSYNLVAENEVERMTFGNAFTRLTEKLLRMKRAPSSKDTTQTVDDGTTSPAENSVDISPDADSSSSAPEVPCSCGMDTCYCKQIGDVCGCTKK